MMSKYDPKNSHFYLDKHYEAFGCFKRTGYQNFLNYKHKIFY